ncbi:hypothetical protein AB4254_08310 [Vibrio breoganii]
MSLERHQQQLRSTIQLFKQVRNNEWEFIGRHKYNFGRRYTCDYAMRNGSRLWIGTLPGYILIDEKPLGIYGRALWHLGIKQGKRRTELRNTKTYPAIKINGTRIACFLNIKTVKNSLRLVFRRPKSSPSSDSVINATHSNDDRYLDVSTMANHPIK